MTAPDEREYSEQAVFAMFAKAAGLPVLEGSIQSRKPPEPDILCELAGEGSVSFELVEIVGEKFSQYTNSRPALRRRFAEAYAAMPADVRSLLEGRLGGPPAVIIGFVPGTSPGQWSRAITPILETLREHRTTIEAGEFRVGTVPRLRGLLTDMWIHSEGPSLHVAEGTLVADPAVDLIRAKFEKRYTTIAPIELFAYYAGQPAPSDSIWMVRVASFFESHLGSSPFRRVWILDGFTRTIVLDSDAQAALGRLVRLKLAQPIAQKLADLPHGSDLVTLASRGAKFRGGRARGALDPLDRVLVEILKDNPNMNADDVLKALKRRAGDGGVIVGVRRGIPRGSAPRQAKVRGRRVDVTIVGWRHPEKGKQETAWSTIRTHRLSRVRDILLAKPR